MKYFKPFASVLLLITSSHLVKAQFKGEHMVGAGLSGNFNIQNEDVNTNYNSSYNLQIALQYGYFRKPNAALIPSFSYSRSFSNNSFSKFQSTGFGIGLGLLKTVPIFSGLFGSINNQFSSNYSKSINESNNPLLSSQQQVIERDFIAISYSLRPGLLYRFNNRVVLGTQLSLIGFSVSMYDVNNSSTAYRASYNAFGSASAAALQFSFYYFLVSKLSPKSNESKPQ